MQSESNVHSWTTGIGKWLLLVVIAAMALSSRQLTSPLGAWQRPVEDDVGSRQIDFQRVEAAGLRVIRGDHLTLITDIRGRPDIDELPKVFDLALPQWCEYFAIQASEAADWHLIGCVVLDQRKFQAAGLWPTDLPPFPAGFQRGDRVWLFAQQGDYYTRHLLLHEGTHAFMEQFLGGYGPPWYSEGMAELLAVHSWRSGKLQLKHSIGHRDEVPYWGRVKIVRDDFAQQQALSMEQVMAISSASFQKVRFYGWAWAACEFLDSHPDFQQIFRRQKNFVIDSGDEFNRQFRSQVPNWSDLERQWQMMISEIEYGYDVAAAVPVKVIRVQATEQGAELTVSAQRGWQATGFRIDPQKVYHVRASGEYQIKNDGQPWSCQPGGVTLQYYRGRPLGQLIAAVATAESVGQIRVVGLEAQIRFESSGELWLRVNESPAHWRDNLGTLNVVITEHSDRPSK